MRLLIIEDDRALAGEMKVGLERQGFAVDLAHTGLEGEEKAYVTLLMLSLIELKKCRPAPAVL